jgi:wobble nucleotide-excising tRNase
MINNLTYAKGLGIFRDYAPTVGLKPFNRFNLFYGCNGSGKSTIAALLRDIELKRQSLLFPDSQWKIASSNGDIDNNNVEANALNIRVFNKDFVIANVFTPDGVKGIVYISEKSGSEKAQLDVKLTALEEVRKEQTRITHILDGVPHDKKSKGLRELNENFLSDAAKKIKAQFKVIEIQDNRLLNYDKTKLKNFIGEHAEAIKTKKSQLSVNDIEKLSKSIKPQDKVAIDIELFKPVDSDLLDALYARVRDLCSASITSKSIERLKQNPEIANWVYQGLKKIHTPESQICEFCGQPLLSTRLVELNGHFSDEFTKLQDSIAKGIVWLEDNLPKVEFPHSSLLYEEFVSEYEQRVEAYADIVTSKINQTLEGWKEALISKQKNPFENLGAKVDQVSVEINQQYKIAYKMVMDCVDKHNNKFKNLEDEIKEAKRKLELHYVSEEVALYDFFTKKEQEERSITEQRAKSFEIDAINISINALQASLSDEHLGEKGFNDMLHKFLGRNDLCLEHRAEGGYIIKRDKVEIASNDSLSEGERTAIGLVYFITKIKENGNKIEDTIVVLDDPISSFDSNHLFHANYYIKQECEAAKQLFVFTHNFRFFALLKDWVCTKKAKDATNKNVDLFHMYLVKPYPLNDIRQGHIENADNVLTQFDSEYHLLFSEVKKFCENPQLDYISTHTIANISRQLLESFLSFKFGRTKLQKCFDNDITGFAELSKVRKFVNHYSHKMDSGDAATGFNDNVFSEADKVVPLVLDLIKHIDATHHASMLSRINNS